MGSVLTVMIGGAHSRFRAPCHASLVTQRAHGHGARVSGERTRAMAIGAFAAISAAMAVAAGAFGAHGASGPQEAEWLRTGGLYQLVHAGAALAIMGFARGPAIMSLGGAARFSLTLFSVDVGPPPWLEARE